MSDKLEVPPGWRREKLKSVAAFKSGATPPRNRDDVYFDGGNIPWVKTTDLTNGYVTDTEETITPAALEETGCELMPVNCVLVAMYGGFRQIGRTGLLLRPAAMNQALTAVIPEAAKLNSHYLLHWLNGRVEDWRRIAGSSRKDPNITKSDIMDFGILLPPLPEQERLGEILSGTDHLITLTDSLLALRLEYKRGLIQQLVTGKMRFKEFVKGGKKVKTRYGDFPEDWSQVHISDIADEAGKKNGGGRELPVLSCTKHRGLVNSLEYFGKRIFSEDTSTYRIVERGDFAYATNHIEEGSIGYQNLHDAALISPMYTVFRTKPGVDHEFFWKLIKTELYRHIFEVNTSGSIARRGALRWDEFALIKVFLPTVPEQKRIAAVLNICDEEIKLLEKQLDALKEQKRGLMQKLLTGEIRVKTN
jgi:type I restriction enzyme S subunit